MPLLVLAAVLLAVASATAVAGPRPTLRPVDAAGRAQYVVGVLVDVTDADVRELLALGFDLEADSRGQMIAYLTAEEIDKLEALGIGWRRAPDERPDRGAPGTTDSTYHDHAAVTARLQQVALDHPQITRLVSAGLSVQGRELWWLRITDNPDVEEDEPGFKYIATMHGDEPVGTENCLELIDELTDNYGTDPRLTNLVDEIEIWIMPLMNPDGNALGQRYNANGADLNRDFPDRIDDPNDSTVGRQPETQHVITWQSVHTTSLSANFHTGALVVNYPYDNNASKLNVDTPTPDDDIVRDLSLEYSEDNLPMYNGAWPQGITNGADWYVVAGGMQDWNYDFEGDIEVTIELSDVKWPAAALLPGLWNDNRESMISFLERALTGVRGLVTDADTGQPVAAELQIANRGVSFYTDPDVGDFHRPLPAGDFDLIVAATGYQGQTVPFTVADATASAVRVDVALQPLPTMLEHAAHRIDQDSGADGYLDPGENGNVAVTLRNLGEEATGVAGELLALTAHATPTAGATWPTLATGAEAESNAPHAALSVSPATPPGHKLGLAVRWTTAEGPAGESAAFFVPVGAPQQRQDPATGLPLPIADFTTVESSIVVPEDEELDEVNVRVDVSHTYIGDLVITLVAPDGSEVRLHDRGGGSSNDIHTWYDTETPPVDDLGVLAGKPSPGTWTLRVEDRAGGDQGTLDGWSLERFSRVWEDPLAEVLLRGLARTAGGVQLDWWPVGSATSYRVYRSADPSAEAFFLDVTSADPDPTDTTFEDRSPGPLLFWIVSAEGHTGEGLWGHFER